MLPRTHTHPEMRWARFLGTRIQNAATAVLEYSKTPLPRSCYPMSTPSHDFPAATLCTSTRATAHPWWSDTSCHTAARQLVKPPSRQFPHDAAASLGHGWPLGAVPVQQQRFRAEQGDGSLHRRRTFIGRSETRRQRGAHLQERSWISKQRSWIGKRQKRSCGAGFTNSRIGQRGRGEVVAEDCPDDQGRW